MTAAEDEHAGKLAMTEDLLRFKILRHDSLAAEQARVDDLIARLARDYADLLGLTVRPSIDQLRNQLLKGGTKLGET